MAEYEMQELNLPQGEGQNSMLFPRMRIKRQVELDELVRKAVKSTTLNPAETKAGIELVIDEIARQMGDGCSIHIEGLGRFVPSLSLRKGKERESSTDASIRRNAQSIEVGNITFSADRNLLQEVNNNCTLQRSESKFRRSSNRYTPQERLQLALEYLKTHEALYVSDYCELTGLLQGKAAAELRQLAADETTGIRSVGRAPHRWYIKR